MGKKHHPRLKSVLFLIMGMYCRKIEKIRKKGVCPVDFQQMNCYISNMDKHGEMEMENV